MKPVTLTVLNWKKDLPMPGHYIASARGRTAYLVLEVRRPTRPCKYVAKLICERRGRSDLAEPGAIVHGWKWSRR